MVAISIFSFIINGISCNGTAKGIVQRMQRHWIMAKFINAEKREEFDMITEKDPYIKSAYGQLQLISQDEQK